MLGLCEAQADLACPGDLMDNRTADEINAVAE